ncbi:MAG: CDP-alcohol phosphatidyltransferase family protein [Dissulfurimicrobium sp.]|uniref:CDP-alcohol phosphatidyltransferase family protein n=1 Tax=Dissulfurimicrobium sp. TaxID=2022436 RepID=UPI004049469A
MRSFSDWARDWSRPLLLPVARFFLRMGIGPNAISLLGLAVYVAIGAMIGAGYLSLAGFMLAVFGPLDAIDGLAARENGMASRLGAFLDSTIDRYAEFFLFLGLMFNMSLDVGGWEWQQGPLLVLSAMSGSFLVSYARARAEALGFECKVGLLTRFERLFILAVGLIFDLVHPALMILAIFTHITAIHRIVHVYRQKDKD